MGVIAISAIGSWPYPDPGALLGRKLGVSATTAVSTVGGNSPQLLVNEMAERIGRNQLDVALIGGSEAMHTRWRAPARAARWSSPGRPATTRRASG